MTGYPMQSAEFWIPALAAGAVLSRVPAPTSIKMAAQVTMGQRCRCPICGHEFHPVENINVCPTQHYGEQEFTRDQLIGEDDDYLWCQ